MTELQKKESELRNIVAILWPTLFEKNTEWPSGLEWFFDGGGGIAVDPKVGQRRVAELESILRVRGLQKTWVRGTLDNYDSGGVLDFFKTWCRSCGIKGSFCNSVWNLLTRAKKPKGCLEPKLIVLVKDLLKSCDSSFVMERRGTSEAMIVGILETGMHQSDRLPRTRIINPFSSEHESHECRAFEAGVALARIVVNDALIAKSRKSTAKARQRLGK